MQFKSSGEPAAFAYVIFLISAFLHPQLVRFLKLPVIIHQLFKRHRLKTIQIDACIQQIVPRLDTWPKVHIGISVDMSVNHV